jgi:hypothetical protein
VTQVIRHLPSKHEALSSNPSTTKEKKREMTDDSLRLGQNQEAINLFCNFLYIANSTLSTKPITYYVYLRSVTHSPSR